MRLPTAGIWFVVLATFIAAGVGVAFCVSWTILPELLFGEGNSQCRHDVDLGTISRHFFEISSDTGYHPEPNRLNWVFTFSGGVVFGAVAFIAAWRIVAKK